MKEVRAALTVASFKVADFASHSFHIGAATTASPEVGQGFDLDNIQKSSYRCLPVLYTFVVEGTMLATSRFLTIRTRLWTLMYHKVH